jgi:hypothetical protein
MKVSWLGGKSCSSVGGDAGLVFGGVGWLSGLEVEEGRVMVEL